LKENVLAFFSNGGIGLENLENLEGCVVDWGGFVVVPAMCGFFDGGGAGCSF